MSLFNKLFGSDKTKNEPTPNVSRSESAVSFQNNVDEGEIVAAIMAALMNIFSVESDGGLHIKSIRRIGRSSPVWNVAGRDEYIATKL